MKKWLAANWKLNKSPREASAYCELAAQELTSSEVTIAIYPQNFSCSIVAENLNQTSILWGAQNCYFETNGAFTGENSPSILKEMGASTVLIGHSERRQIFGESDALIAKKVTAAQSAGLIPMLCIGETIEERKSGRSKDIVLNQLEHGLADANADKEIAVAYEPVWAIGTGEVATPEMAEEIHKEIRTFLREKSKLWGEVAPILYGGSVKPNNAAELSSMPNINGFLVGGASLEVESFKGILERMS